jgi:hypothetical protein
MSARRRKLETRTLLTILLVVLIIIAIAYFILNSPDEPRVLTVEEVLTNPDTYLFENINDVIIVKGELSSIHGTYNYSLIHPTTDPNPDPTRWLNLDTSAIKNETTELSTGTIYKISGRLMKDESSPAGLSVILIVTDYKAV